jgi:hypothetical protein
MKFHPPAAPLTKSQVDEKITHPKQTQPADSENRNQNFVQSLVFTLFAKNKYLGTFGA